MVKGSFEAPIRISLPSGLKPLSVSAAALYELVVANITSAPSSVVVYGNAGYVLLPVTSLVTAEEGLPPKHQLIFDSFELVAANSTTVTTISAFPLSPFQQQQQ
jgi:hypothetical protein